MLKRFTTTSFFFTNPATTAIYTLSLHDALPISLFPKITLTGLVGFASTALSSLFTGGAFGASATANAAYTIFNAGAGRANVRLTEAQRNAALATYQKAVQTAFREVSDALARRATMDAQLAATQRQQAAEAVVVLLAEARYSAGTDSYLNLLDARRTFED